MLAQRLADTRLAVKVLIAPLLLVGCMLILAGIFQISMTRQGAALEDLHQAAAVHGRFVARVSATSTRIQSNAYRLLGWSSAGVEAVKTQALEKNIRADAKDLFDAISSFAAAIDDADDKALIDPIVPAMAAFQRAVGDVADMAALDPVTGLIMMTSAEVEYDKLQSLIAALVKANDTQTDQSYAEAHNVAAAARFQYFAVFLACLVIGGGLALATIRLISRPVVEITKVMDGLAAGDMAVEVHSQERQDEIGAMARAVAIFQDGMRRAAALESEKAAAAKSSAERAVRRETLTESFDQSMKHMLDAVMTTVQHVHTSSDGLQDNAARTSRQGAAVAEAASGAAANVDTVAAAAEQLGASVQEISRQIAATVDITSEAVRGAQAANDTMASLDESAKRIGEVVTLINTIASQTNLLALNATIEAARAGDAGKGFAVVANEVKSLANQTAKATDEITTQIASVQSATHDAVARIRAVSETIDNVSGIVSSIASAVEQQSAATQEIVRSVQQAAEGNGAVTRNIADVSRAADETGTMAKSMFSAANELLEEAQKLRGEVSTFLVDMRG
ncbi:methyl-accepting chemotaxis protein [Magnetospirillum sulfuroxidans]|uniref:HAMP domain-containing protein n=1 Tax=Magnetospirillum sulfuroxidans TaxID=611300 RepID=A0ABS5IFW4_9PROT|nr:methyl-accepting chemotaxis protein [Magnetospirillum sulfuroxidans]MBR9973284.1 HAMP domain-containing protein [Magnetospirillum sulfuroxidans]